GFMVRIVWGVILILLGLFGIGQTFVGLSFLQMASQISGKGTTITGQMLAEVNFVSSILFGVALCLAGSLMIYFGSQARREDAKNLNQRRIISDEPQGPTDW
ncbi:MAG: hypothetical protein Q7U44_09970, partial [Desulfuromonadales bacterium]|nr:hypothetical protein [Desulfuromonadales bacterium]